MGRRLSRRTFVAASAIVAAACGSAAKPVDLPPTLSVASSGDEIENELALSVLASQKQRTTLLADVANLTRLDAATSLRTSNLGDALVQAIDAIGLDAERRSFLAVSRELPSVSVRVNGDFVLAVGMIYSAIGVVEGPLRRAEVDDQGTLHGSDVLGAVVLVSRGVAPFREIGRLLEDAGAAAVIIHNNRPGLLYGTLSQPSSIPVVAVTQEAGDDLVEQLDASDARAVIDVSAPPRSYQGANVIGHRAGPLRRRIIVTTPADAPLADYANGSNADGLALLLALARYANELKPRHSVTFIAFDATHRGYVGSRWYLAQLSEAERDSIDAVLAFDRPGRAHPLQLGSSPSLASPIDERLKADGQDLRVSPGFGIGRGDHDTFVAHGVPFAFLARAGDGQIEGDQLLHAFQVAAATLEVLDGFNPATTN